MVHKIFILLIVLEIGWIKCDSLNVNILMPDVSPKYKDAYLCTKLKLDEDKPIFITEFSPNSTKEIAHHILLFSCDRPGSNEKIWECGEMHGKADGKEQYSRGPVCKGEHQSIIYAWAMDAPKLTLPKDVAFRVGGNSDKKYLVMQVHYANVDKFIDGETDNSGISLKAQHDPVENLAGVFLLETGGYIKPNSHERFESACEVDQDVEIIPFAYRAHAHKLGIVNSGYVVKTNPDTDEQQWIELGRRSPQLPQMFYPVTNNVKVKKGDILTARCTMENHQDRLVKIGSTGDDEMCNFYVMYYVKGEKKFKWKYLLYIWSTILVL